MRYFISGKLAIVVLTVLISALGVSAQKSRVKPKPLATPPPTLTGAEIISRADDPILTPVVTTPSEKAVEKPATVTNAVRIKELNDRIQKLESDAKKSDYDEKQKRMLLNLDILTRAEQRSESLRKQLFEMIEKENTVKSRLDQIDIDSRPENIERSLQLTGSMKPEEVRENKRKSLLAEKANLETLLNDIQSTHNNLTVNLQKADVMVDKLRTKLEKDIDDSFLKDDNPE